MVHARYDDTTLMRITLLVYTPQELIRAQYNERNGSCKYRNETMTVVSRIPVCKFNRATVKGGGGFLPFPPFFLSQDYFIIAYFKFYKQLHRFIHSPFI